MMTAPRLGVSLFQKEKKRKRGGREALRCIWWPPRGLEIFVSLFLFPLRRCIFVWRRTSFF
jgi:hypothetical protein